MVRRSRQRSFLQEILLSNWNNKGTAMVLAFIIWGIALGTTLDEQLVRFNIELACENPDEVVIAANVVDPSAIPPLVPFDGTVRLRLKGQRRLLAEAEGIQRARIVVKPGPRFNLDEKKHYPLPPGVEVTSAEPAFLEIRIEKRISVPVRVVPRGEGEVEAGLYTHDPALDQVNPEEIELVMPKSYQGIVTLHANFDLSDDRVQEIELGPDDIRFTGESLDKNLIDFGVVRTVNVTPGLLDATKPRTLLVRVRFAVDPGSPYQINTTDDKVGITCKGTDQQLDDWEKNVESDAFCIVIIVRGYTGDDDVVIDMKNRDTYAYVGLPKGVQVTDWVKPQFSVKIVNPTE